MSTVSAAGSPVSQPDQPGVNIKIVNVAGAKQTEVQATAQTAANVAKPVFGQQPPDESDVDLQSKAQPKDQIVDPKLQNVIADTSGVAQAALNVVPQPQPQGQVPVPQPQPQPQVQAPVVNPAPQGQVPVPQPQPQGQVPVPQPQPQVQAPVVNPAPQGLHFNVAQQPQPPQPVLTDVAAVQKVQGLASTNDPNTSTQNLLKDIIQTLQKQGYTVDVQSQLATTSTGRYDTEPFTLPTHPDQTFYQIAATYKITAEKKGVSVSVPAIQRTIYTTSTSAEKAGVTAHHFKEAVVDLAKKAADPTNYKGKLTVEATKQDDVMKQRSFTFNFSHDATGNPTSLTSLHSGTGPTLTEIKVKPFDTTKYEYLYDFNSQRLRQIEKGKYYPSFGQTIFTTEEEALLRSRYSIKNDQPYERLEKDGAAFKSHIDKLHAEIEQKEKEFTHLKGELIKEPLMRWFKTKKTTEYKEFLTGVKAQANLEGGKPIQMEGLSKNMQMFIQLKQMQDNLEIDQDQKDLQLLTALKAKIDANPLVALSQTEQDLLQIISVDNPENVTLNPPAPPQGSPAPQAPTLKQRVEACIDLKDADVKKATTLTQKLNQLKDEIAQERMPFNQNLTKLQMLNVELQKHVGELKTLQAKAKEKILSAPASPQAQQLPRAILAVITDDQLKQLDEKIKANEAFTSKIRKRLAPLGANTGAPGAVDAGTTTSSSSSSSKALE